MISGAGNLIKTLIYNMPGIWGQQKNQILTSDGAVSAGGREWAK
jgi:hypothetical protein